MKLKALILILVTAFLLPWSISGCSQTGYAQGDEDMDIQNKIPPIDAKPPAEYKTATFALG